MKELEKKLEQFHNLKVDRVFLSTILDGYKSQRGKVDRFDNIKFKTMAKDTLNKEGREQYFWHILQRVVTYIRSFYNLQKVIQ